MKLANRVALVTGASGGIGRGIALRLAEDGAQVIIHFHRNHMEAEKLSQEIADLGRENLICQADVTKGVEVQAMVEKALARFGRIDILVNNAGGSARDKASLFHLSAEDTWDWVIGLNLKSTLLCTRAVIESMIKAKEGKIINVSSAAGLTGEAGLADYSAAKAAVIGFTKALAKEVGRFGIRVHCIAPALIETPALLRNPKEVIENIQKNILVGRLGKPKEVGNLVSFLASDEANYMTGGVHLISGGSYIC
jgi:3-oxoacyl-[acyl-carrier protein] reductase